MRSDADHPSLRLDAHVLKAIRAVPHFKDSQYAGLDIAATLDYFRRKFVDHIYLKPLRPEHVIADIGCGYGWLSIALGAFTPAKVIAVDADPVRLRAAAAIADLIGVGSKIEWRTGTAQDTKLADQEADVTFCIEVLEHVQRDARAFAELERITRRYLVLTTPNGAFPVIAHDTRLPFCHWLPMKLRDVYARACRRLAMQSGNRFWTPADLYRHLPNFVRVSRFLHYRDVADYFAIFPMYLPYDRGEWRQKPTTIASGYYRCISYLGRHSHFMLPSLAGTFERTQIR